MKLGMMMIMMTFHWLWWLGLVASLTQSGLELGVGTEMKPDCLCSIVFTFVISYLLNYWLSNVIGCHNLICLTLITGAKCLGEDAPYCSTGSAECQLEYTRKRRKSCN